MTRLLLVALCWATSLCGWNGLEFAENAIVLSTPIGRNIQVEIDSLSSEPLLLTSYLVSRWPSEIPYEYPRGQYVLIPHENIKFNADCASLFPDSCYIITISLLTQPKTLLNPKKYVVAHQEEIYWCLLSFRSSEPFHLYRLNIGIFVIGIIATGLTIFGIRKLIYFRYAHKRQNKEATEKLDRDMRVVKFKYPELTDPHFIATHPYNTLIGDQSFLFESYCQAGEWLLHDNQLEAVSLWKKDPTLLTTIAHNWAHINMCKYMHTQVKSRIVWLIRVQNIETKTVIDGIQKITDKIPSNIIASLENNARIHAFDVINKALGKKISYNYDDLDSFNNYLNSAIKKTFHVDYLKEDKIQGPQDN